MSPMNLWRKGHVEKVCFEFWVEESGIDDGESGCKGIW